MHIYFWSRNFNREIHLEDARAVGNNTKVDVGVKVRTGLSRLRIGSNDGFLMNTAEHTLGSLSDCQRFREDSSTKLTK
jgi:hypothetical protein